MNTAKLCFEEFLRNGEGSAVNAVSITLFHGLRCVNDVRTLEPSMYSESHSTLRSNTPLKTDHMTKSLDNAKENLDTREMNTRKLL